MHILLKHASKCSWGFEPPTLRLLDDPLSPFSKRQHFSISSLTWDDLAVSQTHDLPIEDTASPAEGFEELHFLLINNVFHHFWVFPQLWKGITLQSESESERRWGEKGMGRRSREMRWVKRKGSRGEMERCRNSDVTI